MSQNPIDSLQQQITGVAHVGYVVADIEAAIENSCRRFGLAPASVRWMGRDDPQALCVFAFIEVGGLEHEYIQAKRSPMLELLGEQPQGAGGINHVAWLVKDMNQSLQILKAQGVKPGYVTPDGPFELPDKFLVYLNPDDCDGHLIELIQLKTPAEESSCL
ncbi:VOC family protein [Paraferrimonas sedimenticola]|uniref:VOC domain-containing protein n=1 Tax=Paraferrimonas sedimenticola TaxID=375674 RepID=A0AA37RW92_9GAMM|nr:VOC family protein [Paraferrimonas sedimenticola]GLP96331.1 hypothetical protein GCM10007895_16370 [Paraferrimonas sedimenticola]